MVSDLLLNGKIVSDLLLNDAMLLDRFLTKRGRRENGVGERFLTLKFITVLDTPVCLKQISVLRPKARVLPPLAIRGFQTSL